MKFVLPTFAGVINALLTVWDIYNQQIIRSMGMGWDTGAPLWPYQTPDTLLYAMNFPAYLVAGASDLYFTTGSSGRFFIYGVISPMRHISFFLASLIWWFVVGLYIDNRFINKMGAPKKSPTLAIFLATLTIAFISFAVVDSRHVFRWWWTYSREIISVTDLIFLRGITPSIWCLVFAYLTAVSSKRRFLGR